MKRSTAVLTALLLSGLMLAGCGRTPVRSPGRTSYPYASLGSPRAQARLARLLAADARIQIKQHYWGAYNHYRRVDPRRLGIFRRDVPARFYPEFERVLRATYKRNPDLPWDAYGHDWSMQVVTLDGAERVTPRMVVYYEASSDRPRGVPWLLRLIVDLDQFRILYWEVNTGDREPPFRPWSVPQRLGTFSTSFDVRRAYQAARLVLPPGMGYEDLTRVPPGKLRHYFALVGENAADTLYFDDQGHVFKRAGQALLEAGTYPLAW